MTATSIEERPGKVEKETSIPQHDGTNAKGTDRAEEGDRYDTWKVLSHLGHGAGHAIDQDRFSGADGQGGGERGRRMRKGDGTRGGRGKGSKSSNYHKHTISF
eukprot:765497-Hanusia_phi.AAC.3